MPLTDEVHLRIGQLVRLRLPWLVLGLAGGTVASLFVSRFEKVLLDNIHLAFFLPLIVYMSDAVGSQTETLYVRNLALFKSNFAKYLGRELVLGLSLGAILGVLVSGVAWVWLRSAQTAVTVGLAMFIDVVIAPLVAVVVAETLYREHTDPALGAGPATTVIQDVISLLVYFSVASLVIWL